MTTVALEIVIILLLLLINGLFAMSEMAVVSARKARLQHAAEEGNHAAATALALAREPAPFLSTVQIGITLIGILAGAFSGATLSRSLSAWLEQFELLAPYSAALSVLIVVGVITFLSLVIGELTPKRLALANPERVATLVAPPMTFLARLAAPLVSLLNFSSEALLRLLGVKTAAHTPVTEEEIKIMIEQGTASGVFEPIEEELVDRVFRLGDRSVKSLIIPRSDIVGLALDASEDEILRKIVSSGYARFPVVGESLDDVRGVVRAKDLLAQRLEGKPLDLLAVLQPPLFVPETMPALAVLERFKAHQTPMALVLDEFGGLVGLVTVEDVVSAIVGEIPEPGQAEEPEAFQRPDGTWLVDGMFSLEDFHELFNLKPRPEGAEKRYESVGGLVMAMLNRVPVVGDWFEWQGLRMEVVDMDGRRVDKVLVTPLATAVGEEEPVDANDKPGRPGPGR